MAAPRHEEARFNEPEPSALKKRIRWATQHVTGRSGTQKPKSLSNRYLNRMGITKQTRKSAGDNPEATAPEEGDDGAVAAPNSRTIYFNQPLPLEAKDSEGRPLVQYKRNKIKTAKYTPLTFVPKNLWLQFHNIANVYFLFLIILSIFPIFGAASPGLTSVPLIVIIVVTAIKDGIEDWGRTVLDNELNNTSVHRLVNWQNVNTADEVINPWRKSKKACTRAILWIWQQWKDWKVKKDESGKSSKNGRGYAGHALDLSADPQDGRKYSVWSQVLDDNEDMGNNAATDMEMKAVPSSTLGQTGSEDQGNYAGDGMEMEPHNVAAQPGDARQHLSGTAPGTSTTHKTPVPKRFHGSLVDSSITAPEHARFKKDYWKNVQVGDFVRLYNQEEIPADIIVLSTSNATGACFVETKSLDGETNLKARQALHSGRRVKRARDCECTNFRLESEPPHANLYSYSGAVRWLQKGEAGNPPKEMVEAVGINNMVLRGHTLRNTDWIVGIVAFTGEDTKILLNSGITPTKRTQISKDLNVNVLYNFVILFIMCLVAAVVQGTTFAKTNASLHYFEVSKPGASPGYGSTPAINGVITFWAAIILFQNLVPQSLYITLEIIRTAQAFFIYSDTHMYYEKLDYPCTPKSWNISDDVGQVEYIFSDKTGTLTQNVMEFKKCTINGVSYGELYNDGQGDAQVRAQIAKDEMLQDIRHMHNNPYLRDDDLTFIAPTFINDLVGKAGRAQKEANERFMLALALCHTAITERTPGDPPKIEYKAESPDEAALVATARDVGFTVIGRSNEGGITINQHGIDTEYTVLNTLEFNSTRKRMSVIVRMPDGTINLFCKGADSIIYSRLERGGEQADLRKTTAEHLDMFARQSLRTLCVAVRVISEDEYQQWNIEYELAAAAVQDREKKLEAISDTLERDLTLIGGTAIEDRLQEGVPESIAILAQASIKLWVLTGDKVETAINIGLSCNLLNDSMERILLQFEGDDMDFAERELDRHLSNAQNQHGTFIPTYALIIDGDSLTLCLSDRIRQKFLLLCKECRSVLCCRVSPAQKAAVVRMVKNGLQVITLAIGDGANDVAMIQEAHVGVGIAGEEGRQAVMSADYAIGQFRFLTRLVLVHGRWSYRRLSETIANFFYKNIVWTFALFWYQIYTNFDCSYAFDYTYITLYNLAFTSLLVIFMGILDQDVDDKISIAVPQLYRRGVLRKEWTQTKFWTYMIDGLYQSVICFYFPFLLFRVGNFVTDNGRSISDYKRLGVYIATPAVVVVNAYLMMNTYRWDWFLCTIAIISSLLIFFWTGVYTSFTAGFTFYGAGNQVLGALSFWAVFLIVIILCLLPRFIATSIQKIYFPRDVDIVREQIRQGKFDYLNDIEPSKVSLAPTDKLAGSASSSAKSGDHKIKDHEHTPIDDMQPLYPLSATATGSTHKSRSRYGSDSTDCMTHRRFSLDRGFPRVNTDHLKMSSNVLQRSNTDSENT